MTPFSACALDSVRRGEPLPMQAPAVSGWLLVEHPGPWGPQPGHLNPLAPQPLREAAQRHGVRIHLVRRPGRNSTDDNAYLVGPSTVECLPVTALTPRSIATLTGGGTPVATPVFLTCTHGRVDACCARFGRPIAATLAEHAPGRVWETTHVGGCRFAPNVVCLPSGVYYGRLPQDAVAQVVRAAEANRIVLRWYRGRAGLGQPAQFADLFLRRLTGTTGVDELQVCETTSRGDQHLVRLRSPWGEHLLLLREKRGLPGRIACSDTADRIPVGFEVVSAVDVC